jgi:hypothetical protein
MGRGHRGRTCGIVEPSALRFAETPAKQAFSSRRGDDRGGPCAACDVGGRHACLSCAAMRLSVTTLAEHEGGSVIDELTEIGGARADHRFDRSARIVRRPRGSVGAGPSAARGRGRRRDGRGSARSRPTAPARARGTVLSRRRRSGSSVRRRRWWLVSRSISSTADRAVRRTREPRGPGSRRPFRTARPRRWSDTRASRARRREPHTPRSF